MCSQRRNLKTPCVVGKIKLTTHSRLTPEWRTNAVILPLPVHLMACTETNLPIFFLVTFLPSWRVDWLVGAVSCFLSSVRSTEILICATLEGLTSAGWWRYQTVIGVMILRYRLVSWLQPMLVVGRSEAAQLLGSRVRIPLRTWMCVCCVGSGICYELITHSEECYWLWVCVCD